MEYIRGLSGDLPAVGNWDFYLVMGSPDPQHSPLLSVTPGQKH